MNIAARRAEPDEAPHIAEFLRGSFPGHEQIPGGVEGYVTRAGSPDDAGSALIVLTRPDIEIVDAGDVLGSVSAWFEGYPQTDPAQGRDDERVYLGGLATAPDAGGGGAGFDVVSAKLLLLKGASGAAWQRHEGLDSKVVFGYLQGEGDDFDVMLEASGWHALDDHGVEALVPNTELHGPLLEGHVWMANKQLWPTIETFAKPPEY